MNKHVLGCLISLITKCYIIFTDLDVAVVDNEMLAINNVP